MTAATNVRLVLPGVLLAMTLAACREAPEPSGGAVARSVSDTSVLGARGSEGTARQNAASPAIAPPPVPSSVRPQVAQAAPGIAMALWIQDGRVMASSQETGQGWAAARALEQIYGEASDPQLASNGDGKAMALWQHTVGSIESLRFSRWQAGTGWSIPDVMPGALPRPRVPMGDADHESPRLRMDAQGNAWASWPSGFDPHDRQTARYINDQGWSRAAASGQAGLEATRAARSP